MQLSSKTHTTSYDSFVALFLQDFVELLRVEAAGQKRDRVMGVSDRIIKMNPVVERIPVSPRPFEDVIELVQLDSTRVFSHAGYNWSHRSHRAVLSGELRTDRRIILQLCLLRIFSWSNHAASIDVHILQMFLNAHTWRLLHLFLTQRVGDEMQDIVQNFQNVLYLVELSHDDCPIMLRDCEIGAVGVLYFWNFLLHGPHESCRAKVASVEGVLFVGNSWDGDDASRDYIRRCEWNFH